MQESVRKDFSGALAERDAAFGDYEKKVKD